MPKVHIANEPSPKKPGKTSLNEGNHLTPGGQKSELRKQSMNSGVSHRGTYQTELQIQNNQLSFYYYLSLTTLFRRAS